MIAFLVAAPPAVQDIVIARLSELGTAGIEEKPAALLVYFEDETLTAEGLRGELADIAALTVEAAAVPDVDWVARFREGFRAFAVAGFWITPVWEAGPAPAAHRRLVVDPGRAFGTGTHESTALCLEALSRLSGRGPLGAVIDVGTGSGILAAAAAQLGAASVVAADIDPECIDSARRHAAQNDVRLRLVHADGGRAFAPRRFDTLIANITAPLLIERADELCLLVRPGGRLVLAGLLETERERVTSAYSRFGAAEPLVRGEWAGLIIEMRAA